MTSKEAEAQAKQNALVRQRALNPAQRDHIIDVVITETIRIAESQAQDRDR
jgi:hypothetical protein